MTQVIEVRASSLNEAIDMAKVQAKESGLLVSKIFGARNVPGSPNWEVIVSTEPALPPDIQVLKSAFDSIGMFKISGGDLVKVLGYLESLGWYLKGPSPTNPHQGGIEQYQDEGR